MSAIAGIYFLDGRPADPADLERMVERLAHRGPDGSAVWASVSVGLGHRMLRTTPESLHEKLPLRNSTKDLILTADARLDNRNELMSTLGITGRPPGEITDSELILGAYERWGERCPEKLLGDFAFALWDRRAQALFCARDHFGVKPFYYYRSDRLFAFASEIKALLSLPEVPRRLNEVRVADYLVPMLEDKVITFYQEILRLPPAHAMIVSPQGASLRSYWALDPTREIRYRSDEEYADAFREIFTEAVRCRLRSAYPVGSMLSGGLDSSSIVCVARRLPAQNGGHRLHTFSAIFPDVPECDERPFINAVLAPGGLEPHYVHGDQLSPLADLEHVLDQEDEPFYAPNLFLHWGLYSAAEQHGIRVLLDGLDGDTTISHGIGFLVELARTGRWTTLASEVTWLSKRYNRAPWSILFHLAVKPLVPEPVRLVWRVLRNSAQRGRSPNTIISPGFARRIGLAERTRSLLAKRARPARTSIEDHWRRLTSGVIPFALEVADRTAAAFSIEPRYPFFDRRVVEFCLALPPEQKLRQGWTRMVMRRAMAKILPAEVQWRSGKADLSPNFIRGLLGCHERVLEEVILNHPKAIEEYVDMAALGEAYQRYTRRGAEHDSLTVWKSATLALWLRRTGLTNGGRT